MYTPIPYTCVCLAPLHSTHPLTHPTPHTHTVTAQLLREAQTYSQITPLQVSLLCQLCSVEDQTKGTITLADFRQLLPNQQHTFDQIEPAIQPVVVKETERSVSVWVDGL